MRANILLIAQKDKAKNILKFNKTHQHGITMKRSLLLLLILLPLYSYAASKQSIVKSNKTEHACPWRIIDWPFKNIHDADGIWIETFLWGQETSDDLTQPLRLIPGLLAPSLHTAMTDDIAEQKIRKTLRKVNERMLDRPEVVAHELKINLMVIVVALERSGVTLRVSGDILEKDKRLIQTYLPPLKIRKLPGIEIADMRACQDLVRCNVP